MSTIRIRFANADDAGLLVQIGARYFYDAYQDVKAEHHLNDYISKAFEVNDIRQQLENNSAVYLIASNLNNLPVGYVKLRSDRSHANLTTLKNLEVERIYVDRNYWRSGIGKDLFKACVEYAMENKYDTLWLGVWQKNERAIQFYQSQGMEIFGTKKFWVGEEENDDFVLKIDLT